MIFIFFKVLLYIYISEKSFYSIEEYDIEKMLDNYQDTLKSGDNGKRKRKLFDYLYKNSPMDRLRTELKSGIVHGIKYLLFHLFPEFAISTIKYRKFGIVKYEMLILFNIVALEISRLFLGFIPGFSIFYVDNLLFVYMLATILATIGALYCLSERENIFNQYIILITTSTIVFIITLVVAAYYNQNEDISKQSGLVWMISYILMITPFGFVITIAKLVFSIMMANMRIKPEEEQKAMLDKMYE